MIDLRTEITLVLPYPPSANRIWRTRVQGRKAITYLSQEGKDFKAKVAAICAEQGLTGSAGTVRFPTGTRVGVSLAVYRPRKSRDLDNVNKITLDAMNKIVYEDDEQITRIESERFDRKNDGGVVVRVWAITDNPKVLEELR